MAVNNDGNPAKHFGRQLKKERTAHGWTLREFSALTGLALGYISQIETGKRPPTERVALACDAAFPERHGWFLEYYTELSTWSEVPAGFKDWGEYEDHAPTLLVWETGVVHGLLQTEAYARALLTTSPSASAEAVTTRLAARMERQQRVLLRGDPPTALFLVDEVALYRLVGTAECMAEQMRHLLTVAALPNVTLQAVPLVAHAANASGFMIAGEAAWAEHVAGGGAYTGERLSPFLRLFDTLRYECRRVTETTALIERMCESWTTNGGRPQPQMPMGASASR